MGMDNRELATLILLGATVLGVTVLAVRKPDFRASLKGLGTEQERELAVVAPAA